MRRFYCPNADFRSPEVSISSSSEVHHIRNVLKVKKDDCLVIFNGNGEEAVGLVSNITHRAVTLHIKEVRTENPQAMKLILACAVPKKAKFESIIEKCTELGIDEIIPLQTDRTEIIYPKARSENKLKRFREIAVNASKQSQRSRIPIIQEQMKLSQILKVYLNEQVLGLIFCLPGKRISLSDALLQLKPQHQQVIFFIGPEGDFTSDEIDQCVSSGCTAVTLGNTVLKVDTAAISVVAITQSILSQRRDLNPTP